MGSKHMVRGHVYILINACMPGLVKIGHSIRSPEERAQELSQTTGVPMPYIVAYQEEVVCCDEAEREIHRLLDKWRVNRGREFFSIAVKDAIQVVAEVAKKFRELERAEAENAKPNRLRQDLLHKDSSLRTHMPGGMHKENHTRCDECGEVIPAQLKGLNQSRCPKCRKIL
jgi:hypothetical protein